MAEQEDEHALIRRYADYFRKAEEAEGMAVRAHDEGARKSLHVVALGWRKLAEQVRRLLQRKTMEN
jgi:hypothetical protein